MPGPKIAIRHKDDWLAEIRQKTDQHRWILDQADQLSKKNVGTTIDTCKLHHKSSSPSTCHAGYSWHRWQSLLLTDPCKHRQPNHDHVPQQPMQEAGCWNPQLERGLHLLVWRCQVSPIIWSKIWSPIMRALLARHTNSLFLQISYQRRSPSSSKTYRGSDYLLRSI